MDRRDILYLALILGLVAGLGNGQMLGSMISPLSYHVCERTATVNVSKVVPFQKPLQEKSLCMGWIPWKLCSKTYYVTEYRTIWVPETMIVKECCEGYEPVGHYCAMATKSPSLTTSRPGACPANIDEDVLCPECTVDYDCPGFQKCCETSTGSFCVSPKPPALDRNTIKFWYNGTFTIKMKFNELILLDPGYINHTRLLHAMVTGELWPLEVAVYHICTQSAGSFTIASRVFIGLNESVPLQNIATSLNNIAIRLPEVINVQLDDLDECLHRELGSCPPIHHCTNTEGSYNCSKPNSTQPPPPGGINLEPGVTHPNDSRGPGATLPSGAPPPCYCSAFLSHSISGVTTNGFHLSWSTGCPDRHVYNIQISSAKGIHRNDSISGTSLTIRDLDAGEVYAVLVTFRGCSGETHAWEERVQTEGQILNATLKIENRNFTDSLLDPNSTDYKEFEETFISQVKQSLSGRIPPEKISVKILSLSPGSIDANFLITINDTVDYISDAMASLMAINESSGVFKVDPQSIKIAVVAGDLSPTSMASTESTVGISSTASNDTSPPTTSSTSEHVTDATAQSIQSTIELHQPTLPTDDATFAVSKPEIPKTGQSEQSSPITSTTEPLTHEAPITSTTEPLTHEAPITSTTEPLTHEAPITSTTEPLTHEAMNTDLIITALNDSKLTTIHGVDWTTNDKGNPTMTSTKHSTTKPTMSSSAGNKGVATLTSTTAKLATVQEVVCPLSVMSKISDAEATSMPRLALQATTTHRTPSLTLKDASKVICGTGMIGISMEKAFLKMMSISSHSLFLGSPECSVNCSTDTHIFIQAGWKECSTNVSSNATHIFVSSTLYIDLSTTNPNATPGVVSFIRCVFHNQFLWSSGYNPSGGFYTIIEKLEGGGTFFPEFQLFIGDQPIPPNFTLSATDDITVRIGIRTEESHFKVVINDCWATPTEDAYDSVTFPFIKNSCALPNTFTTIQTNGVSSNATFQTKIFSFVNKPIVYLHCRLSVCQEVVPNACKPSCSGLQASVRSGGNVFTGVTRMGPLRMASQAHDEDAPASATLGPGYIILIAIGVLAAISIIIAVLVCWHQRRTGNYNFRMKKRNASYRVFSN